MKLGIVAEALELAVERITESQLFSICTRFTFVWLMLQKRPKMLGFSSFSNGKKILQNLRLAQKEVALKVHAGEQMIHVKS